MLVNNLTREDLRVLLACYRAGLPAPAFLTGWLFLACVVHPIGCKVHSGAGGYYARSVDAKEFNVY